MSLIKLIFSASLRSRFQIISVRYYSSKSKEILDSAEEVPVFSKENVFSEASEIIRNKSRLTPAHRNILRGQNPYDESMAWYHNTVKYKKRILGRYGMEALKVPAGLAWPTPEEVEDRKEYERIAYPLSIQEQLQKIKEEKKKKEEALMARQMEIAKKMAGMKQLINQVQAKIADKEMKELEAKERKKRKIEEVRQQLIAQGMMNNANLTDALSQMEKEEKKRKKEMKKQKMLERQKKMVEIVRKKLQDDNIDSEAWNENVVDSKKE
ncbi:hypothetical protein WN48_08178 [Eufriesea mexicana]|uniref:Large ribosomal subunit protein mL64 n=1 Tax=Eufriesea mexicana TaxID=516756 RepID=A0A310SB10_9HYME|nr:PREDICTED: growth arrest and DNA damage-inducible proteins-interacting protein 1 [Eufriesea mexicana]OAD54255.1 hypothetical protein WN48_08178 [Eufriesea mexicana]